MSPKVDKNAELAYGSGQVNPTKAISPGLIYDLDDMSYIQFLCHEGYDGTNIGSLAGQGPVNCSSLIPGKGEDALNYPTIQLELSEQLSTTAVFRRTVTNVGRPESIYNVTVKAPAGAQIMVKPTTLNFSKAYQKRSFRVTVKAKPIDRSVNVLSASITWRSSHYTVRTPIALYNPWLN